MDRGKDINLNPPHGDQLWFGRWPTPAFLALLLGLGIAASLLLLRKGNGKVLLIALVSGTLLLALEYLEVRYIRVAPRADNPLPGYLAPALIISIVTLAVCLPTVNIYFLADDFEFIHLFRTPSLHHFLRLFVSDESQGTWEWTQTQELRPLVGLSYMLHYYVWYLHPIGYHLSNIFQHALSSWLVFLIARNVAPGETWRASFSGLLFAVLPIHAETISWFSGFLTDGSVTLLYLAAFLCFILFRRTGLARFLVMSTLAFAGCLLTKEMAVTLPAMLVSYDLFQKAVGESSVSVGTGQSPSRRRLRFILAYAPFAVLLLAYLILRWIAFGSFLREGSLGLQPGMYPDLPSFVHQLGLVWERFRNLESFSLRALLLPFPMPASGFVLGLYLAWAVALLRDRRQCRSSMAAIVYFGLLWYLISSAPLLATYTSARHLYLPAVGPCIAVALLAKPGCGTPGKEAGYLRLLGALLLVCLSAGQLWKENREWARMGAMTAKVTSQLAVALAAEPQDTLVIVRGPTPVTAPSGWHNWDNWPLPYFLEEPFTPQNLYSRVRVIETPEMYCYFRLPEWWKKTKLALNAKLAGTPDELIRTDLLSWDEHSNSFERKMRFLPRKVLHTNMNEMLGQPLETVHSINETEAYKLVNTLARLVSEGS